MTCHRTPLYSSESRMKETLVSVVQSICSERKITGSVTPVLFDYNTQEMSSLYTIHVLFDDGSALISTIRIWGRYFHKLTPGFRMQPTEMERSIRDVN